MTADPGARHGSAPPSQPRPLTPQRLRANVTHVLVMSFTWMFVLVAPIFVPFLADHDLGMAQVYRLQTVFALGVVLLEVPSGYVSDLLGRRGCLIAAGVLHGVAFSVMAVADSFLGFAVFEALAAVAVSLYSGTDVALLYDSLEALGQEDRRMRTLGRRVFWLQAGQMAASLLGGALALVSLQLTATATAVVGWLPLLAALGLREVPRRRLDRGSHLRNLRILHHELFRRSRLVRLILFNHTAHGLATVIAVWAFQGFWTAIHVPLAWFGSLWAAYNLTIALVARSAHRVERRLGMAGVARAVGLLSIAGYVGLALCAARVGGSFWWVLAGIFFGFCFQVGRGLNEVVLRDALNTRVPSELRATANSLSNMGVRLSFAVLGPLFGWLIDGRGYAFAFGSCAAFFGVLLLGLNVSLVRELRRAS